MSSPIPVPHSSRTDASPSSPGLYIPVHRRTPSAYASSSGTLTPSSSPSLSSRALSPSPSLSAHAPIPGVYTPAELLSLSRSPLVAQLAASHGTVDVLRAVAPEVVQSKKQRKTAAWHARHPAPAPSQMPTPARTHRRTSSRGSHSHTSESEEERAVSWRRV